MSENNSYFQKLNAILKMESRAVPFLIIDLDRLDANIALLERDLNPSADFRIVVKSLPSFALLEYVMQKMSTNKLMVFHQPFLTDLSDKLDDRANVLLGKPMPIKTTEYYYENLPESKAKFDPYSQVQWLVDSSKRLSEYIALARRLGKTLRLNLEIDVGLHRGGCKDLEQLQACLALIQSNSEHVAFSGLMGYDPHVAKIPKLLRSQEKSRRMSNTFYHQCQALVKEDFPALWHDDLTFNGAGSPTLPLHKAADSPLNDISAGSCLVMPSTFDASLLAAYQPACFIATPVLKKLAGTTLPGLEKISRLATFSNRHGQSFFIYGGYWKADYVFPEGIRVNKLFGPSTNQTMLNAPRSVSLEVDDFVFLRPQQSEFVFLQFGKILAIRGAEICHSWAPLDNCI